MEQQFGKWGPFVDPDHLKWYDLPLLLEAALKGYTPDGTELEALPEDKFQIVLENALALATQSVVDFPVRYHNIEHFREVVADGLAIVVAYDRLAGTQFPRAVVQAFLVYLVLHDVYHQGSTFRSDAPTGMFQPDLGVNVTTEWVSSVMADQFAAQHGFNPLARLFGAVIIWASTYGATAPRGKELDLGRIVPSTFFELAMVVADVAPDDNFVRWVQKGVSVTFGEKPASPAPSTWTGWLKNRIGFLEFYVLPMMAKLNAVANVNITGEIGWGTATQNHVAKIKAVQTGAAPELAAIMKDQLVPYASRIDLKK